MNAFTEIRLERGIDYGVVGGPSFRTTVVTVDSGREYRSADWPQGLGRWNLGDRMLNKSDLDALLAFFRARRGRAIGFRFQDFADYQATAQALGTGDGSTTTFQLVKRYASSSDTEVRTITKPVASTVSVYKNGVLQTTGVSVSTTTGLVTFTTAPAAGVAVTADFQFDVPVRFDVDFFPTSFEATTDATTGERLFHLDALPVVEILL